MLKTILKIAAAVVLTVIVLVLVFVGPWPVYSDSHYQTAGYFKKAIADIDAHAKDSEVTATPGRLLAGWGVRDMTPWTGVPLAGYGARRGAPSTGVRDKLHVRALALGDGKDTMVLVGSDMLIIPPNIAEMVREAVAKQTPLTPDDIVFNASHTHCGPGGWAPGIAARVTGGGYDEKVPPFIAEAFTGAIVEAYQKMEPAKLAHGSVDAPNYVRNRVRKGAPVDSELSFLVAQQEDGDRCFVANFSAHPTIFDDDMLDFSAEWPGALIAHLERQTQARAMYLSGSVGSTGPQAPDAPTDGERVDKMGQQLGDLLLAAAANPEFKDHLDVVSIGIPLGMPAMQLRPFEGNPNWRVSPLLAKIAQIPTEGWIHGARVGDVYFLGAPCDLSGEISIVWKEWGRGKHIDLWTMSFCAAYCGYFTPDKYYKSTPLNYETGLMSWYGPNVEAYFTDLFQHLVAAMAPPGGHAA